MVLKSDVQNDIKRKVGEKAASLVQNNMLVGLGSGSTASCFISSLIERCKQGLNIQAVCSSIRSAELAKAGGIPLLSMEEVVEIDLTIDGADEINAQKQMIKGGGGAHVREKILASTSKEVVIIVDESKVVEQLGQTKLPVEILPFGYRATVQKIKNHGYEGTLRTDLSGQLYLTDNGNYLYDIYKPTPFTDPTKDHEILTMIPGVLDTGFFFNLVDRVIIGYSNGQIEIKD